MNIEIKITADSVEDSVEELQAVLTQLGKKQPPTVNITCTPTAVPEINGGELTIPAGTDLKIAAASRDSVTLTSDLTQEPMKAPEKPKRTRKAAAKPAEAPQEPAREPEAQQPETVAAAPAPAAETQYEVVAEHPAAEDIAAEARPTPTKEQIAVAGARLLDADPNSMAALLTLLKEYDVQAITYLKDDQLAGFAEKLRALGAEV